MPTDEKRWKDIMVESGRMPDDNGVWHYNPQAIENPLVDIIQSSTENLKKYIDSETLESTNIQMDKKCVCCPYMFEYKCRNSNGCVKE